MLHHATDPSLCLIEDADVDAEHPPTIVRDHAASLSRILRWAQEYLCQPNDNLGRAGAVCPFVEQSLKQRHFYLTVYSDQSIDGERVAAHMRKYCDWFPSLEPRSGHGSQFKTILVLFPQADLAGVSRIIETTQARLKPSCVERGLMIGEFHPGPPPQPGLWNRDFRPLFSPIPLLAIRHMVPSDFAFLQDDRRWVLEYLKRFGDDVPLHLRDKVQQAASRFGIPISGDRAARAPVVDCAIVNFSEMLARFSDHWAPKVIAQMNDYQFKLVKILGDVAWQQHPDADEAVIVLHGTMSIEFRDARVELEAGEMFIVPKGVEHRRRATSECEVLLVEPRGVVNAEGLDQRALAAQDVWL